MQNFNSRPATFQRTFGGTEAAGEIELRAILKPNWTTNDTLHEKSS